jgi:hypothetical protein
VDVIDEVKEDKDVIDEEPFPPLACSKPVTGPIA